MIILKWAPYPEASVGSYHVFRAIIGFLAPIPLPAALSGLTLQLALNGGSTQTITFDGVTDVITSINNVITGGQAYASIADNTKFLFRSDIREAPGSVQIVGGTALSVLGLTAMTLTQESNFVLLATVAALLDPTVLVEYDDPDGALQDYYQLTSLDTFGNESLPTTPQQPISSTGDLCVIEGIVTDLQGVRLVDKEVRAILKRAPTTLATGSLVDSHAYITTLTGPDGRFSLPLLQDALVRLEIPATGYSRYIKVPDLAFAFITDLEVDTNYQFTPDPLLGEI